MQVLFNTNNTVNGHQRMEAYVSSRVNEVFKRFDEMITRVEVHLSDQNGDKPGKGDQQCRIEVRLRGMNPITVTSREDEMEQAINNGLKKALGAIDKAVDKARAH